jgi:FtsP/CotA-like multicopper oxidase with cupredoxin domain
MAKTTVAPVGPGFSPTYPAGTGVPGPGVASGGPVDWSKTGGAQNNFSSFGCKVPNLDPINTPDWQTAPVYFERRVFTDGLWKFADGKTVPHWGFEDRIRAPDQKPYPSPLIRLREGELAHVKLETRLGAHTIHHHGIEPTTMNDGVGHVSFETSGSYVYQWRPTHAGTWFYHCHVNTVLHFEMGLYGPLIVDPPATPGVGTAPYRGATTHRYDVEALWVVDDVDPRWHGLNQAAGLCGEDVGLNIFKPKYFFVSGAQKRVSGSSPAPITDNRVAITARKGQRILIRMICASYSVVGVKIAGIKSELIAVDGHAIASPDRPWSSAKTIDAGGELTMPSASRHDLWIDTSTLTPGVYPVEFKWYDWVTKKVHNAGQGLYEGSAATTITIT